jgi:hypothetical protein
MDPKKSIMDVIWPVKNYEDSPSKLATMSMMNRTQPYQANWWGKLLSYGTPQTGDLMAGVSPYDPITERNQGAIADFAKERGIKPETWSQRYMYQGTPGEQSAALGRIRDIGKEIAKDFYSEGPNIGKAFAKGFQAKLEAQVKYLDAFDKGTPEDAKLRADYIASKTAAGAFRAPRLKGTTPYFSAGDMGYRATMGDTPLNQFYNKAQEENITFTSATMTIFDKITHKNAESIYNRLNIKLEGLAQYLASYRGGLSGKDIQLRKLALMGEAEEELEKLKQKTTAAFATTIKDWAAAEIEGIGRIEVERKAEQMEFSGSTRRKLLADQGYATQIKDAEDAIDAKYARKRQERLAVEAKIRAEMLSNTAKDSMSATIASLKGIYERGGLSVGDYYAKQKVSLLETESGSASSWLTAFMNNYETSKGKATLYTATTPKGGVGSKSLNDLLPLYIKALADKPSIPQAIKLMDEVYALMTQAVEGGEGDVVKLMQIQKSFADHLFNLKTGLENLTTHETTDREKFNASIRELTSYAEKTNIATWSSAGPKMLGIRSFKGAGTRWGSVASPYAPAGFDIRAAKERAELEAHDIETAKQMATAAKIPGGPMFGEQRTEEDATDYYRRVERELQKHQENKANISEDGMKKLEAMEKLLEARARSRNEVIVRNEKETAATRIQIAGDMAGTLTQTATMLYEASGKKSAEMFYLMKAFAFAEAIIKGTQAVINAIAAGTAWGGPAAPAVGAAFGAVTAAMVGAQLGIIAATTIQGPGKAKGGPVEGGTGEKDDVHIMAMGGEYVIQKKSVQKYGSAFLDALNRGLISASDLQFSVPSMPDRGSKIAYGDGGIIGGYGNITPNLNVVLENKSGVQLKAKDQGFSFDGKEYVRNIVLELVDHDPAFNNIMRR